MVNSTDFEYTKLVNKVLRGGEVRSDRTGTGTISLFGTHSTYDLRDGFPLLTTKRVAWKTAFSEMLWFIDGCPEEEYATESHILGRKLWQPWECDSLGNDGFGPIYGVQWRDWGDVASCLYVDQLKNLLNSLKEEPFSRRHLVTAWNPTDLNFMALPPCHFSFQCYVSTSGDLDMQLYQRSADLALGVPFNIAGYSLLMHLICRHLGDIYKPRYLHHSIGDAHVYLNHVTPLQEQLTLPHLAAPTLRIHSETQKMFGVPLANLTMDDYVANKRVTYPVSV